MVSLVSENKKWATSVFFFKHPARSSCSYLTGTHTAGFRRPVPACDCRVGPTAVGRAAASMMGFKHALFCDRARPRGRRSGWHKLVSDYAKQMTASLVRPPQGVIRENKQTHSDVVLWVPAACICTDTSDRLALRTEKGQRTKAILVAFVRWGVGGWGVLHALSNWLINTTPAPAPITPASSPWCSS